MKKVLREVEVFDCGNEGCAHRLESQARSCKERTEKFHREEKLRLQMFKAYIGSRRSVKGIAAQFGVHRSTVRKYSIQCIRGLLEGGWFDDNVIEYYGSDLTLSTAIEKYTYFWLRAIDKRLKQLKDVE